jgi:hypothetical protein
MTGRTKKQNITVSVFIFTLAAFTLSQLVINSVLSPLGIELQNLNREKNYLVEENRSMEEKIAKSNSITVIKKLADKELSLSSSNKKSIVYIEEKSIIAERQ